MRWTSRVGIGSESSTAHQCPLWVKGRHCVSQPGCPLYPQKRTSRNVVGMSAKCQERTSALSLDHLVGAHEERFRNRQAQRFRRFEIDNKLDPGRLFNGKIGRLCALENLVDVVAGTAEQGREVRPVGQETSAVDITA